jgi:hypothetical protein
MASTKKWSTELKDTGYITKEDLKAKLKEVFESEGYEPEDFKIAVRAQRFSLRWRQRNLLMTGTDQKREMDLLCTPKANLRKCAQKLEKQRKGPKRLRQASVGAKAER